MKTVILFFVFIIGNGISDNSYCQNAQKQKKVLLTKAQYIWADTIWDFNNYKVFEYNDNDLLILSNSYILTSSGLFNNSKNVYEYYEDNNSLKYHYYYESLMGIGFDSYGLDKFYYDDSLRLIEQVNSYNLDGFQTVYSRLTYEYEDYLFTRKNLFTGTPDNWELSKSFIYYYDNQGKVSGYYSISNENGAWVKSDSAYYNYDNYGYILKKEFFIRNNEYWERYNQYIYIYSEDYSELEEIFQQWQDSLWINISNTTSWLDEDGFVTEKIYQEWEDSIWVNKERWLYYYGVLGQDEETVDSQNIIIFPNPNSGKFYIRFTDNSEEYSISVFNSNGQQIFSIECNNSKKVPIDISGRPDGLYFVKVTAGSKTFTEKVIVQ
jgi:hypothetical protein